MISIPKAQLTTSNFLTINVPEPGTSTYFLDKIQSSSKDRVVNNASDFHSMLVIKQLKFIGLILQENASVLTVLKDKSGVVIIVDYSRHYTIANGV